MNLQRLRNDVLALALLALAVFLGLALASYDAADPPADFVFPARTQVLNWAGPHGADVAWRLMQGLGVGAWFLFGAVLLTDLRLFSRDGCVDPILRTLGIGLALVGVCAAAHLFVPPLFSQTLYGNGGYIGSVVAQILKSQFTPFGCFLWSAALLLAGIVFADELTALTWAARIVTFPVTGWSKLAFGGIGTAGVATAPASLPTAPKYSITSGASTIPIRQPAPYAPAERSRDDDDHNAGPEEPRILTLAPLPMVSQAASPVERAVVPLVLHHAEPVDDEPQLLVYVAGENRTIPIYAAPPVVPAPVTPVAVAAPPLAPVVAPAVNDHPAELFSDAVALALAPRATAAEPQKYRINPPVGMALPVIESALPPELQAPREYRLPDRAILESPEAFPYEALAMRAQAAANTLEKTFREFGLNIKVVAIDTGPVITQFELELEAGLRLAKVAALADDLAIALRVPSVRVVAPIPGRNTVGVEVPNDIRVMVRLKELIESCPKDFDDKRIPLYFGKDVSGHPLVVDMCKLPHLLIAGRTGTGKSVCLNTLIASILMTRTPDQVRMLMIDPKMVELSPYTRIPHLMHPVITDMRKAEAVLGWAVDQMEERYDLLARVGVRHLDLYNKLGKTEVLKKLGIDPNDADAAAIPEKMPYIVIIADEMADMMMTSGKDVEGHIIRLAQKSRAVGIHLVLATQKPTVDVITGLIKSNLPARIAFQVASKVDSRVVLDEMGADKLLGNGDMLYLAPGSSTLSRAQGTYISDEEVNRLIEFYSDQEPQYCPELVKLKPAQTKTGGEAPTKLDPLYGDAVDVVLREGRGSTSLLQRALGVGYGRAAKMVDRMSEDGIVGEFNGGQAREVLMSYEDWEQLKARLGIAPSA